MNIFVTSPDPLECAKYLDDKRVNKMAVESAQMLSTVLRELGVDDDRLYKSTHKNHPCTVWAGISRSNYLWLMAHLKGLTDEFQYRFGKEHACAKLLSVFRELSVHVPMGTSTLFPNCTTHHKHIDCVYKAYQQELDWKWQNDKMLPRWTI